MNHFRRFLLDPLHEFYNNNGSNGPDRPLKNLALAILLQAFRDLINPKATGGSSADPEYWRQDAIKWFWSEENSKGSFLWACGLLESIEPDGIRSWLLDYALMDEEEKERVGRRISRHQIQH